MSASLELSPTSSEKALSLPTDKDSTFLSLGKDLNLDLWFRGNTEKKQSVLIRTTTPEGKVKTAFMHINGTVQQVPVFESEDPLVLESNQAPKVKRKSREFTWSPEKEVTQGKGRGIFKAVAAVTALVFLASLLTGFLQLRVVLTGSMKPAIQPGDLIVAASTKIVTPEKGDVVLYSARDLQGKAVTVWSHRIISGDVKSGFTIKGDANPQPDLGIIPVKDIQSIVVAKIPFVGHLFNLISLILICAGLLIFSLISRLRE